MFWQLIETAPKDGTQILAFGRGTDRCVWDMDKPMPPTMSVVSWHEAEYEGEEDAGNGLFRKVKKKMEGHWKGSGFLSWFTPTHWQALPPVPEPHPTP